MVDELNIRKILEVPSLPFFSEAGATGQARKPEQNTAAPTTPTPSVPEALNPSAEPAHTPKLEASTELEVASPLIVPPSPPPSGTNVEDPVASKREAPTPVPTAKGMSTSKLE